MQVNLHTLQPDIYG